MSNITLQPNKSNDRNDEHNTSTSSVTLDMEVAEIDEIQKDSGENKSLQEIKVQLKTEDEYIDDILLQKEKHVGVVNDILKPYSYIMQGDRPVFQNVTWVQYTDDMDSSPLSYSPDRNQFVLLVFSLVLVMLLCTAGFNVFVLMSPAAKQLYRDYGLMIMLPCMLIMMGMSYAMACSPCTRTFPCNYICLIISVLCMSLITAYFTTKYQTSTVIYAVVATSIIVMVCMGLAFTSFDFTKFMLYVIVISAAFGAIALVASLGMLISQTYIKPLHLGLLIVGTLIQAVILVMELQTILGGRTVELSEDDYALGAFMLYTSIVDIFIKMVQILGMSDF